MGVTAFFNKPVTLSDDYYWIKKYGWENDIYRHDFAYIEKVFDECNQKNNFLG